jgi:ring-1,2-phenylacetyl-CoA epoxidase subunit PaaD
VVAAAPDVAAVWERLERVLDPEVPVLSVVELGIVRRVDVEADGRVTVSITPTYSGCPAMRVIEDDIIRALAEAGWRSQVRTVYSPAWTTDWIGETAREKLRAYGIAPPTGGTTQGPGHATDHGPEQLVPLQRRVTPVACPYCGSRATVTRSEFGPTACKSIMFCQQCRQPFEQFKAI